MVREKESEVLKQRSLTKITDNVVEKEGVRVTDRAGSGSIISLTPEEVEEFRKKVEEVEKAVKALIEKLRELDEAWPVLYLEKKLVYGEGGAYKYWYLRSFDPVSHRRGSTYIGHVVPERIRKIVETRRRLKEIIKMLESFSEYDAWRLRSGLSMLADVLRVAQDAEEAVKILSVKSYKELVELIKQEREKLRQQRKVRVKQQSQRQAAGSLTRSTYLEDIKEGVREPEQQVQDTRVSLTAKRLLEKGYRPLTELFER